METALAREVRERAGNACEYCRMPQTFYPTVPFPIDTRGSQADLCAHS